MAHTEAGGHEQLFSNSVRSSVVLLASLENIPSILVLQTEKNLKGRSEKNSQS